MEVHFRLHLVCDYSCDICQRFVDFGQIHGLVDEKHAEKSLSDCIDTESRDVYCDLRADVLWHRQEGVWSHMVLDDGPVYVRRDLWVLATCWNEAWDRSRDR